MAKTPKRLHGPAQLSGAAATKYTVPAGTKTIMRYISVNNPSGAAVAFTLSIGADAATTRKWDAFSIPAAGAGVTESHKEFWCYEVLEVGEIIQAFASAPSVLVITIDGDEYTPG